MTVPHISDNSSLVTDQKTRLAVGGSPTILLIGDSSLAAGCSVVESRFFGESCFFSTVFDCILLTGFLAGSCTTFLGTSPR